MTTLSAKVAELLERLARADGHPAGDGPDHDEIESIAREALALLSEREADAQPVAWLVDGFRGRFATLHREEAYGCTEIFERARQAKMETVTPLYAALQDSGQAPDLLGLTDGV